MTPLEVVARHEGVLRVIAAEHATPLVSFDDLAQEARAVLWDEASRRPGDNLDRVASYIVNRRLYNVTRHNRMLGAADGERHWEPSVAVWIDGMENAATRERVEYRAGVAPSAEDVALRRISAAEVRAAVAAIADERAREVALSRMAEEPVSVTASRMGVTGQTIRNIWNRDVRPALAVALEGAL